MGRHGTGCGRQTGAVVRLALVEVSGHGFGKQIEVKEIATMFAVHPSVILEVMRSNDAGCKTREQIADDMEAQGY